jgi:hypothetical protein
MRRGSLSRPAGILLCAIFLLAGRLNADPGNGIEPLPEDMAGDYIDPVTAQAVRGFPETEVLNFKLGWSFFTVAEAQLRTEPGNYGGQSALKIQLQARTNSFADNFYRVRNASTSWIRADMSGSISYRARQDEGDRQRDTEARFDAESATARYFNHREGHVGDAVPILPGAFDPQGIVFFVRALDFDVGDRLIIPTSNGKEFFYTIVYVVDRVKRKFLSGRREAWVLEPDIKDVGGVFKRSPDGHIRFFFSADEAKIPLRMESEVAVGKFWAEWTGE